MKYLTVIQARSSSTRLPGKSLMPVGGVPLALLCALRAKNKFSQVLIATSDERSDDKLAKTLLAAGVNVFRGSLNNVLSRFIGIMEAYKLNDDDTIIRLTGDNPVVDGFFLEILRQAWEKLELDYLSAEPIDMGKSIWPKGLSAEFISVGLLRDSFESDKSAHNLEHVTPFVRTNASQKAFGDEVTKLQFKEKFFIGIDELADYQRVCSIFERHSTHTPFDVILGSIGE
ncbi:hypothetical protein OAU90_00615 [Candidatus Pseudothioglobus singularis]|nr:hypothetical protein [Candidatus Pseudothioglobus singularis]